MVTIGVIVAAVAAGALWQFWPEPPPSRLDAARAWVDDDAAWVTALQAGETAAEVSELLLRAVDEDGCTDASALRCERILETAAWARVSSVALLRCTRPGVFAFRADLRDALDALTDDGGLREPPPVPDCG